MTLVSERLNEGEVVSVTNYYTIDALDDTRRSAHVTDMRGDKLTISFDVVSKECSSASEDQANETKKVSRSEIVSIVQGAGHTIFRVKFLKQQTINSVNDMMDEVVEEWTQAKTKKRKREICSGIIKGVERNMVASLMPGASREMGRIKVLDHDNGRAVKLIDTRTIQSLILDGVKYTCSN